MPNKVGNLSQPTLLSELQEHEHTVRETPLSPRHVLSKVVYAQLHPAASAMPPPVRILRGHRRSAQR
jgi:hypothetical protein